MRGERGGPSAVVRQTYAAVLFAVAGGRRVEVGRGDQPHLLDRETRGVEPAEDADDPARDRGVDDQLAGVRPAVEPLEREREVAQVGQSAPGTTGTRSPPSGGGSSGVTGPTVPWNRPSRGGGSTSAACSRRTRSIRGVGSTSPKPSGRSGSGRGADRPGVEVRRAPRRDRVGCEDGRRRRTATGHGDGVPAEAAEAARGAAALQPAQPAAPPAAGRACGQSSRRSVAQRVSSWREDSWSLRSTLETWVSTVLIEMNSLDATSL